MSKNFEDRQRKRHEERQQRARSRHSFAADTLVCRKCGATEESAAREPADKDCAGSVEARKAVWRSQKKSAPNVSFTVKQQAQSANLAEMMKKMINDEAVKMAGSYKIPGVQIKNIGDMDRYHRPGDEAAFRGCTEDNLARQVASQAAQFLTKPCIAQWDAEKHQVHLWLAKVPDVLPAADEEPGSGLEPPSWVGLPGSPPRLLWDEDYAEWLDELGDPTASFTDMVLEHEGAATVRRCVMENRAYVGDDYHSEMMRAMRDMDKAMYGAGRAASDSADAMRYAARAMNGHDYDRFAYETFQQATREFLDRGDFRGFERYMTDRVDPDRISMALRERISAAYDKVRREQRYDRDDFRGRIRADFNVSNAYNFYKDGGIS